MTGNRKMFAMSSVDKRLVSRLQDYCIKTIVSKQIERYQPARKRKEAYEQAVYRRGKPKANQHMKK